MLDVQEGVAQHPAIMVENENMKVESDNVMAVAVRRTRSMKKKALVMLLAGLMTAASASSLFAADKIGRAHV